MKLGIMGLTSSGKTTLYSLLSGIKYEAASLLQLEQKLKVATVKVPDKRIEMLLDKEGPSDKLTYPTIEIYDTPSLNIPAEKVDGNAQAISILRDADGLICVVRTNSESSPESVLGIITDIKNELLVADLSIIEKRASKLQQQILRGGSMVEQDKKELAALGKMQTQLESGKDLHILKADADINRAIKNYGILAIKPLIIVLNLSEFQLQPEVQDKFKKIIAAQYSDYIALSLKLEYELSQPEFSEEEKKSFMDEYKLPGLHIHDILPLCYKKLGLITFFTVGKDEIRGWTIKQGDTALTAAGAIHTDISRGFISAEVIPFQHWIEGGNYKNAKERGKLKLEGKNYIVHDGDIVHYKFNV